MIIQNTIDSIFSYTPEVTLSIMSMVILLSGTLKIFRKHLFLMTLFSVLLAFFLSLSYYPASNMYLFNSSLIKNDVTEFFKYVCYFLFIVQLIVSKEYLEARKLNSGEYYSLLIFALIGCFIIISSNNLITLFLGIELSSLSLYSLIALNRSSLISTEAAIKYFVLSIIASAVILFGFSYLYGITGSLFIYDIVSYSNVNEITNLYLFSYILIFIGIAFKFAVAPFHMWLPDVYEGAPLPVANFIASIPKVAFFVFAFRFLNDSSIINNDNFYKLMLTLGVISVFIGNIFALAQQKIMRMLAYSGVANAGFIFLALLAATEYNFSVAAFYIISYSIATVSAISIVTYISSDKFDLVFIKDLKGMSSRSGYISLLLMITLLSTAGILLSKR
jgi:NADH-quinone oxidoreductase subunit N